jgi:ABC-type sugar transport systems, permease components
VAMSRLPATTAAPISAARREATVSAPIRFIASPQTLLLGPILAAIALFYFGPIGFGLWASFQGEGKSMAGGDFVGLRHYSSIAADRNFWGALRVTIVFTVSTVLATYFLGLVLALALNGEFFAKRFFTSVLIIPWTMPLVVVAVVWGWLLDYQFGAINYMIELLGIGSGQIGFLTSPRLALWSVGVAQVWRMFPLAMVVILAALKAIPTELYEAAASDGATRWQSFRHVTLPQIASTTAALILLLGIWAFGRAFTIVYVMTGGGPARSTETLVIQTYLEAFSYFRLERASALGTIVLVISALLTVLYLR